MHDMSGEEHTQKRYSNVSRLYHFKVQKTQPITMYICIDSK